MECTFYGNVAGWGGSAIWSNSSHTALIDNTVIAGGLGAEPIDCSGFPPPVLSCCDIHGNAGGDWIGCIADQLGIGGNISEDPRFGDLANEDYTLADDSPCAEENNAECGQIGAWPIGCSHPVPVEMTTIGRIKSGFRD